MHEIDEQSWRYWSQRADDFSVLRMSDYRSALRGAYRGLLQRWLPAGESHSVLDAGTGAGFFALLLSELDCAVTAVDFSADMLAQAKANLAAEDRTGVRLELGDLHDLRYEDSQFDMVITRNVVWTLRDAERAYAEMLRVLRPGGVLVNIDAGYGQAFIAADASGVQPVHPTQTQEQLRARNDLAAALEISYRTRPQWDIDVLLRLGVRQLHVDTDIDATLKVTDLNAPYTTAARGQSSRPFALVAVR